jgi:hypothetical protein
MEAIRETVEESRFFPGPKIRGIDSTDHKRANKEDIGRYLEGIFPRRNIEEGNASLSLLTDLKTYRVT